MNDVAVGDPETSHKTLPCVEWSAGLGTYFGGGHIVLGLMYYFVNLDVLLFYLVVCARMQVDNKH